MVRVNELKSLPSPVGGLNARDSIASMDPRDAVILRNWWVTTEDVMLRKGADYHVTDISSPVESLMPYSTPAGTETLFGASGTSFYDVTTPGTVGAAVVTGLTNARWQSVNATTSGGSFLLNFNGVDNPRYWDGSTWTTITAVSTPAITGVTVTKLDCPWLHKNRVWTIEASTLKAWYLPAGAIGGAAASLDLSAFAKKGGYLVAGATWTIDGGDGVDDYWAAITSEGELFVYQGTDPSSASTWALRGVWQIGAPLGKRCFLKYMGDLLISTIDGVLPLSAALQSSRIDQRIAVTDKIQNLMNSSANSYGANFGWQMLFYPKGQMLFLNVPVQEGSLQEQFAMNTTTKAWARFDGVEANCWAIFQDEPYFGGSNFVGKFWGSFSDYENNIDADALQAFHYFPPRSENKRFTMARPFFRSNGAPSIYMGLNVDYQIQEPNQTLTFAGTVYGVWDTGLWDTAVWGGNLSTILNWQSVSGIGRCAAARMLTACKGLEVHWTATDYIYEPGIGL